MTWTYSGDPANNDRDAVRFLIGDTDTSDQQLTDEEIAYLLSVEGSVEGAAVEAIRALIAKYSRAVDKSVGDLRLSYSQRVNGYKELLEQIQTKRMTRMGPPIAGGISRDRKDTVRDDTDRVDPAFRRGQFDRKSDPDDDDNPLTR